MSSEYNSVFCAFCVEVLSDPVLLDCQHSVCRRCAETIFNLAARISPGDQIPIQCPSCNDVTSVERKEGVNSLKVNAGLKAFIAKGRLGPEAAQQLMTRCGFCENSRPIVECKQCQVALCENCANMIHKKGMYKTHTVGPIGSLGTRVGARTHICPEHGKEFDLFCSVDKLIVCSHCLLLGSHKHHPCVSLKDAAVSVRAALQDSLGSLGVTRDRIALAKENIVSALPILHAEYEKTLEEILVTFATLRNAVDAREKEVRDKLYELREVKVHLLAKQIDLLDASLSQVDGGLSAAERLLTREDYEAVTMRPQISARLEALSHASYALVPVTDSLFSFSFDQRVVQTVHDFCRIDTSILEEVEIDPSILRRIHVDIQQREIEVEKIQGKTTTTTTTSSSSSVPVSIPPPSNPSSSKGTRQASNSSLPSLPTTNPNPPSNNNNNNNNNNNVVRNVQPQRFHGAGPYFGY